MTVVAILTIVSTLVFFGYQKEKDREQELKLAKCRPEEVIDAD